MISRIEPTGESEASVGDGRVVGVGGLVGTVVGRVGAVGRLARGTTVT